MNARLTYTLAQHRLAELQHTAEQARLAGELRATRSRAAQALQDRRQPRMMEFTLHARDVAKLDRFISQARRAARRTEREFGGVRVEVDAQGSVGIHATGMTSMLL